MSPRFTRRAFLVFPLLPVLAVLALSEVKGSQVKGLPVCPLLQSSGRPTISYRKVFKDSNPEFVEIKVSENGPCTYDIRALHEQPDAQPFEVGLALRAKIFELAAQLNNFQGADLDVHRRIANLGQKTFRYERGSEAYEVSFNYTINPAASQLVQIFWGLERQQQHFDRLRHRARYDRLGINDSLLQFESDLNRKIIPEPERLVPTLEAIANDSRVMEIARQRARYLAERIRLSR